MSYDTVDKILAILAEEENFRRLARINRELICKVEAIDAQQRIVLDMDSTSKSPSGHGSAAKMWPRAWTWTAAPFTGHWLNGQFNGPDIGRDSSGAAI